VDAAVLVVAELAANAVLHAESDVSIGIARVDGGVRLVVGDTSDVVPASRAAHPLADNGRGLLMVSNIAGAWGHELVDGGKLIWVDLAAPRQ
jgi:anti-sigma regulatory factor (Ser/Thr protein kinase)